MKGRRSFNFKQDAPPITVIFAHVGELVEFAASEASSWRTGRLSRSSDATDLGTKTWDDALRLAYGGWPDGRRLLLDHVAGVHVPPSFDVVAGTRYDYAGAYPDVPRYLSGDPECMLDFVPTEKSRRPIIKLAVSPITNSTVSAASRANWGAGLVSLVDDFERRGMRVELLWVSLSAPHWAWEADKVRPPSIYVQVLLKAADQPLEIDRLAFWTMNMAAHVRMQFAIKERLDIEKWYYFDREANRGYGDAATHDELRRQVPKDYTLLTVGSGSSSAEEALKAMGTQVDNATRSGDEAGNRQRVRRAP